MNIEDIIVKVVDPAKLIDFLGIQLEKNQELAVDSFSVYDNKFIVDTDACFSEIQQQHFNGAIQPVLEIDCTVSWTDKMDQCEFAKIISLKDYLEMSNEIKLIDFIRYNYNERIINNQRLLLWALNK